MEDSDSSRVLVWCSGLFGTIYLVGYWTVAFCGWKGKKARHEAASCCMSLLHGTLATLLTAWDLLPPLLLQGPEPWQQLLDAPNTPFQDAVMEFSIAYFLVDLLHYALFVPEEPLFILHHIATSTYMLSCRYYTMHGAVSVMALLGLAECTSFLQNLWTLASLADSPSATRVFHSLNPLFVPIFTFVRGFLGPWLTWNLCRYYFSGHADSVVPRWLAYYWMSTVLLAIAGSLFWVSRLWARLFEFNRAKSLADAKSKKL